MKIQLLTRKLKLFLTALFMIAGAVIVSAQAILSVQVTGPVCAGETATVTFTVKNGNGNGTSFTTATIFTPFISSVGGGGTFTPLPAGSYTFNKDQLPLTAGAAGAEYNVSAQITIPAGSVTGGYKVAIGSSKPNVNSVNASTLNTFQVYAKSVGGTISPTSKDICAGGNSGVLTLNGSTGSVLRWEKSTSPGVWVTATNTTTTTFTSGAINETTQYRAVVQSGNCSIVYSATTTINVLTPTSVAPPPAAPDSYCANSAATPLTVTAQGSGTLSYQWYRSSDTNTPGVEIPGAITNSYTPSTDTEGTLYYYVTVAGACGVASSERIAVKVGEQNIYNGSWSANSPNRPGYNAVINANYNTTAGNIVACNCTVNSPAILTIGAGSSATVQNNIINNGTITVKNGGNLLQVNPSKAIYSGSGIFKAEGPENMALENGTVNMDYVYWSSPVAAQNIAAFSPGTPTRNLLQYTEKTDYFATTPDAVFKPAKGYALRAETTGVATGVYTKTYVFTGAPNNGFFGAAVTKTGNGYNLVGNPYPSAINFDILQANNAALIDGILYRWNNKVDTPPVQQGSAYDQSNYVTYSSLGGENPSLSGNIAVGMGFIVRSKASGTLNFENAYTNGQQLRVATAATFYKKEVSAKNRFWLALTSPENLYKTQLIGYIEGASDGLDRDFDAPLLSMGANQFFSLLDDNGLVIQGKSENFEMSDKIILGANIASKGKYSISLMQPEGIFASAQKVYLKDNKLNTITDLTAGSYSFDGEVGISESRFEIVYQTAALGTGDIAKSDLVVYKNGNNFLVKGGKKMKSVEVFDASGRMVNVTPASSETVEISADTFLSGLYVLSIKYEDGTMKTKKVIK